MRIEGEGGGRLTHDLKAAPHTGGGAPAIGEPRPAASVETTPLAVPGDRIDVHHTISHVIAAKGAGVAPPAMRAATAPSAIVMIVAAVLCFSLLDVTAKSLVTGEGLLMGLAGSTVASAALFIAWTRFAVHTVIVGIVMGLVQGKPILRVHSWPWQLARSAFLAGATMLNFVALNYLQLAQTVAIFFVAPMVVTALAGPLLGEWVGWRRWLAILAGFCGVLLMARPGTDLFQPALALSIGSMLSYSFYVLSTRKLTATETPESLLFVSTLIPTLVVSIALPFTGSWTPPGEIGPWVLLVSLGVYGTVGHFVFVLAYGRASTGALAPFTYVQIAFMVGLGWLVFGNLPDGATWVGIGVIAAAGLYIVLRERQLHREAAKAGEG